MSSATQTRPILRDAPPASIPPKPLPSLWRNGDFLRLWGGQMVSGVGSAASGLAFPLLALALTHSPARAGLMAALRGIPYALLSLPAGALVDKWNRKRVMLTCEVGSAIAVASVPIAYALGHLTLFWLGLASLVEGTLFVFFQMAESACLARVVPKDQLPQAIAQNEASYATTAMIGPSVGGFLYGLGRTVPFVADAASYAVSALAILFIRTPLQLERDETTAPTHLGRDILEGLRWLWHDKVIRTLALLTCGLCLPSAGWALILIVMAQRMHATPAQIGLLTASSGVGGMLGAFLVPRLQKRFPFGHLMVGATWFWVFTWPLYALAHNLWMLGFANAVCFVCIPVYMGTQYAYRLKRLPDALSGRVNSVFRLTAFGAMPLGIALTGWLLQAVGPARTVWTLFVPQLILGILATCSQPLRRAQ